MHNNLGDAPDAGIELVKQVASLIRDEGLSAKGTYCISLILTRCAARLLRLFADTHYERLTLFFYTKSNRGFGEKQKRRPGPGGVRVHPHERTSHLYSERIFERQ